MKLFLHLLVNFFPPLLISSFTIAQISFIEHTIDGNFEGANSVHAIDVNKDSLIDVLGAGLAANSIALWINDGSNPIVWQEQIIENNFQMASSVLGCDINGDGDIDVIGSSWMDNEIAWWRNDGGVPIQWLKQTISDNFGGAEEVYAIDIDGDNDTDVLGAAMNASQIALWYNNGEYPIVWSKQIIDGSFGWARSVFAEDVNGDSLNDILGAGYTANSIAVWYNNGDSTWTSQIVDSNFLGAHKVYACDLDNDNDIDILGAAHLGDQIAWWRNDQGNPIQWSKQVIEDNFDGAISLYACDVDGDYDYDILGTTEIAWDIALWLNNGFATSWQKQTLNNNFAGAWGVYGEDIDNDGDKDVIGAATVVNDILWWENDGIVGIKKYSNLPQKFQLTQNYPNPFNPTTIIKYQIPRLSFVTIKVYDVLGNEIATLVDEEKTIGIHSIEFDATSLPSGIYFYQLQTPNLTQTKNMILLK